jgi:hypothetical protein
MRRRQPRLRIALFADSPVQPRWMVDAFARIARSDFADVVLIAARRDGKPKKSWLWRACTRLDRMLFAKATDPSAPVLLRAGIPLARHEKCRNTPGEMAAAWRRSGLTSLPLDVAFVLGDVADEELHGIARYGIWRWCFGATHGVREDLAGWREVTQGLPITPSGLRVVLRPGADRLLCQSRTRTYPFSAARNRADLFGKTAAFAERQLRLLHRSGDQHLTAQDWPPIAIAPNPADRPPQATEILGGLARVGSRIAWRGLQKLLFIEQWFIAYRFGPAGCDGDLSHHVHLLPPKDRLWADPFPLCRDGRSFIFFEEMPFATGKGHIAMAEVDARGMVGQPRKVLERDYHLSYPYLIEHRGELFMVPESGQNRSIDVYRCVSFPDVWRFEKTLLRDVSWADATFHHDAHLWWMFVSISADGGQLYDELHIYYADDLLGEWHPHSENPVKSDVCGARPAGRPFVAGGMLHRPAQIGVPLYGAGISVARVLQLTPQRYREEEVSRILPQPGQGVLGIHTLNRSGDLSVVDAFARRRRF